MYYLCLKPSLCLGLWQQLIISGGEMCNVKLVSCDPRPHVWQPCSLNQSKVRQRPCTCMIVCCTCLQVVRISHCFPLWRPRSRQVLTWSNNIKLWKWFPCEEFNGEMNVYYFQSLRSTWFPCMHCVHCFSFIIWESMHFEQFSEYRKSNHSKPRKINANGGVFGKSVENRQDLVGNQNSGFSKTFM